MVASLGWERLVHQALGAGPWGLTPFRGAAEWGFGSMSRACREGLGLSGRQTSLALTSLGDTRRARC